MEHIFSEKIYNQKILFYEIQKGKIRIVIGEKKADFEVLVSLIRTYIEAFSLLKRHSLIKITQETENHSIKFVFCESTFSVGMAFRLYNEIVKTFDLNLQVYSKLYYNQETATKFNTLENA